MRVDGKVGHDLVEQRTFNLDRSRVRSMKTWPSRLIVVAVGLFVLGWVLILASGYGGNSTGGSKLVWRVGGLMLYTSIPTLLLAGVLGIAAGLRSARRRRSSSA